MCCILSLVLGSKQKPGVTHVGRPWIRPHHLARIIHHLLIFYGGCSAKWPIHIANRYLVELLRATAERHSRYDRRYSASL